jgi:hypothetical protein
MLVLKDHQTQQEFKNALSWCERLAAYLRIKEHGVAPMPDMPAAQHAEIAHMRGLLGEMGRLAACGRVDCADCAHVGEAPMSQAGLMDTMYNGWNDTLGFTSARFAADACWELVRLGGTQIPEALIVALNTLHHLLSAADSDEFEWTEYDQDKRQEQKARHE